MSWVYGGGDAPRLVAAILGRLGVRALDPGPETGIFDPENSKRSFDRWQLYRDRVIGADPDSPG